VAAQAYVIRSPANAPHGGRVNLSEIDFDALARYFAKTPHKASTAAAATVSARTKVDAMVRVNPTRESLRGQLEALIADYNDGAHTVDKFFKDLIAFMKQIEAEQQRASAEGLSQEELAIDDLLVDAEVSLEAEDRDALKKIAHDLPKKLAKKLVIDWRKTQRGRAAVKTTIKDVLDDLPKAYGPEAFERVVAAVYEHVYESYWGEGKSKYSEASTQ
jgi:type I restriction enzyme R subunit